MTSYNFLKLPQYILKRPWFLKPTLQLYLYLLSNKSYLEKTLINDIILEKDQILTSSRVLEKALKLTRQKVETALQHLKKTGDIEIKTTNKYSIITLLFEKNTQQEIGDKTLVELDLKENKKIKYSAKYKNTQQNTQQEIGDKTLVELDLKDPSNTKILNKILTPKEEDKNNIYMSILENDFQEWWEKYPEVITKKGGKKEPRKLYIKIRQSGITKQQMLDAVDGYRQMLAETKKGGFLRSSKMVYTWLKGGFYEEYLTEDHSDAIENIKAKIIEIEPEATITVENQEIIVSLSTFESRRAFRNKVEYDNITSLCKEIDYQLLTKSITTQND